jgi:BCD family chlorophyll transporter-like MFS transporter
LLAGILRDVVTQATGWALSGYLAVFLIEALMLAIAAFMLYRIDVNQFKKGVEQPSFVEKAALAVD